VSQIAESASRTIMQKGRARGRYAAPDTPSCGPCAKSKKKCNGTFRKCELHSPNKEAQQDPGSSKYPPCTELNVEAAKFMLSPSLKSGVKYVPKDNRTPSKQAQEGTGARREKKAPTPTATPEPKPITSKWAKFSMVGCIRFFAFSMLVAAVLAGNGTLADVQQQNSKLRQQKRFLMQENTKLRAKCSWLELQLKSVRSAHTKYKGELKTLRLQYKNVCNARDRRVKNSKKPLANCGDGYGSNWAERQAKSRGKWSAKLVLQIHAS